ncbi:MAG: IclR family transcriptional regulator [Firmicutes bacterium]|uniref:Glycerol operon regulatory protein n=1 Tax=Melghirimyces thermohalophilus TaxID=1236220 RepID=A0A1G6K4K2_9BACL|nr:IclR family transcriptional regulator [Melghirimyces thermohalophilus]MDA8354642.1 IclR family transcriptional regulator [Bacillota bacterium]SDC25982.1 transcriptional regulator, IclR family [Melghirimyces thermohalophilus]
MEGKKTVRAAERALDILLCFTRQPELSLTEIARMTELNKSTVFRLLATLEEKGFLIRNAETEKYRLGFRIWELSAHLSRTDDPAILFLPEMEQLRDQLEETVSLYVRDGLERVRVQAVESLQAIRRVAPVGARMPLAVGAAGKVLASFSSPVVLDRILSDPEWPENVDQKAYLAQLDRIRRQGFATSVEEREAGTSAVAVPVFGQDGNIMAALAVSGPVGRLTLERMEEVVPSVIEAAERMQKMLKT